MVWFFIGLVISLIINSIESIEVVSYLELRRLVDKEANLISLLIKRDCSEGRRLELMIENLQYQFQNALSAKVVKCYEYDGSTLNDYQEQSIIYFRRGVPLLFYGTFEEEEILEFFIENSNFFVKELSDENFEHLTQASTGSTTGDWFIFFYSIDCGLCQHLNAQWEAVGAKLKHRINVARINILGGGELTAKRFSVKKTPEFIYLRHGKYYLYKWDEYKVKDFIRFATGGYLTESQLNLVLVESSFWQNVYTSYIEGFSIKLSLFFIVTAIFIISVHKFNIKKKETKRINNKQQ